MAYSYDIPGNTATTLSTLVNKLDTATLIEGASTATYRDYVVNGTDPGHPVKIRLYNRVQGTVSSPARYIQVRISAWVKRTDSLTSEFAWSPVSVSVSLEVPLDGSIEVADLDVLLAMVYGVTYSAAPAGVRDTTRLASWILGAIKF